ncbi:unnamed protein product [Dovyalis caffra]|uniref:Serine aminopeptidase S33 domain-containing protein n=1 Tax=Dovyalis caffra TaxID=77055 RepID=A0AAV1RYA8_9ROSI|nr:unnamed protein product [Dovyalis caffra]
MQCNSAGASILETGWEPGTHDGIALRLSIKGLTAITFDMRGVGRSPGWSSLTGFAEIQDVIAVCTWVSQNLSPNKIFLVGSPAGAPISGSAADKLEEIIGYVSIGYPFGLTASIQFGRQHKAILQSPKPKLSWALEMDGGFNSGFPRIIGGISSLASKTFASLTCRISRQSQYSAGFSNAWLDCQINSVPPQLACLTMGPSQAIIKSATAAAGAHIIVGRWEPWNALSYSLTVSLVGLRSRCKFIPIYIPPYVVRSKKGPHSADSKEVKLAGSL